MTKMKYAQVFALGTILAMAAMLFGGGCATLKKGAGTALTLGGIAKPEYRSTLEQIRKAILADDPSPVDGYDFQVTWRYKGNVVDGKDIIREKMFICTENAADGFRPLPNVGKSTTADKIKDRDPLREEIGKILDAAGITEESQ